MRQLTEYCLASSCRLLRWLTLQAARPEEVHFRHAAGGALWEYERVFLCPVRFGMADNGALLSAATLAEPLVSSNEDLAARFESAARAVLGARRAAVFRDAVACALRAGRMDRVSCRREVIARRLGVSARTLQRRLGDEGTSFGAVLDEMRRQTALELIADPALSVGDVSRGVGYADQFAFNKAFRRWTGRSPSAYRRELENGSA